ncbi:site-specific DNA-methyltransferase [Streptococcus oralis subsp. tigurinus]|jgi:type III restriction-modification system methylation subunit|uniref:site-specific DNA-methyltransferase n=1 Tax=Streptococcus oralis TaxID=1303 RepID=UPI001BD38F55|nr:site-specific DNA-methyltransferase [Streptococcus oralis]MBS9400889.1 site-specific DNA-methyltransferase [Streptococcus oralis]
MSQAFETAIQQALREVVESFDEQYVAEGLLKKDAIITDLDNYRPELVEKILTNTILNEAFTEDIAGATILKINDIIQMLEVDEYWSNSYTRYTNKIGLAADNRYLDETTDVVLNFPYKDGILKAGMTKDDVSREDAEESFLNEIVAREEIDVLLDKKILKNAKKYDKNGSSPVSEIKDTNNLIIKGNNLLALHSLKKRFSGKIKSIIVDPPYYFKKTKSSDAFNYNSNFKLSTWLVFMKNRLDVAKELLSDEGLCIIIVGEEGCAQLKLLADNIFEEDKYIGTISWRKSDNQANIGEFAKVTDYILIYKKSSGKLNKLPLTDKARKEYRYSDENGYFRRQILLHKTRGKYNYELTTPTGKKLYGPWMKEKEEIERLDNLGKIYWTRGGQEQPYGKLYLQDSEGQIPNDFWDNSFGTNQRGAEEIRELFRGDRLFDFPKPERLIYNLMKISSEEGDIVLDFFMGSGTTAAVAHKMNRQYIGIEQMDYIETVAVERLKKVINGEQGGISQDVAWSGGGSFIYAELMDKNATFIDAVLNSKHSDELKAIFDDMKATLDFDFRVDLQEVDQSIWDEDFEMQKKILVKIIDKNQLYHNYSEIDDETIKSQLSQSDYDFNKSFYGEK